MSQIATPSKRGHALIVDDQKNWREVLAEILYADGYLVHSASNLNEARRLLAVEDFDIAILDIRLLDDRRYDVQGLQILQEIRAANLRTCVIVMTGFVPLGIEEHIQKMGAEMFVYKSPPQGLSVVQFRQTVSQLVQQAQKAETRNKPLRENSICP